MKRAAGKSQVVVGGEEGKSTIAGDLASEG